MTLSSIPYQNVCMAQGGGQGGEVVASQFFLNCKTFQSDEILRGREATSGTFLRHSQYFYICITVSENIRFELGKLVQYSSQKARNGVS